MPSARATTNCAKAMRTCERQRTCMRMPARMLFASGTRVLHVCVLPMFSRRKTHACVLCTSPIRLLTVPHSPYGKPRPASSRAYVSVGTDERLLSLVKNRTLLKTWPIAPCGNFHAAGNVRVGNVHADCATMPAPSASLLVAPSRTSLLAALRPSLFSRGRLHMQAPRRRFDRSGGFRTRSGFSPQPKPSAYCAGFVSARSSDGRLTSSEPRHSEAPAMLAPTPGDHWRVSLVMPVPRPGRGPHLRRDWPHIGPQCGRMLRALQRSHVPQARPRPHAACAHMHMGVCARTRTCARTTQAGLQAHAHT